MPVGKLLYFWEYLVVNYTPLISDSALNDILNGENCIHVQIMTIECASCQFAVWINEQQLEESDFPLWSTLAAEEKSAHKNFTIKDEIKNMTLIMVILMISSEFLNWYSPGKYPVFWIAQMCHFQSKR